MIRPPRYRVLTVLMTFFAYVLSAIGGQANMQELKEDLKQEFPGNKIQESDLAVMVCMYLGVTDAMIGKCKHNFLGERVDFGQSPPELRIRCQSEKSVLFSTTTAKYWVLVVLADEDSNADYINYSLIESSNITTETISDLYTGKPKNSTIWTTLLDDEGRHTVWRKGPVVQPWKELTKNLEKKNYEVKYEFLLDKYNGGEYIEAKFTWNSSDVSDSCFRVQNSCNKKTQGDFFEKQIKPDQGRRVVVEGLPLDDTCTFLIAGKYGTTTLDYQTPACYKLYGCQPPPEIVKGINMEATEDGDDSWTVDVQWAKPKYDHDYYNVTLRADHLHSKKVPGNATRVTFTNVTGEGYYNVSVISFIGNRKAWSTKRDIFPMRYPSSDSRLIGVAWFSLVAAVASAALYGIVVSWRNRTRDRLRRHYAGILDKSQMFSESDAGSELIAEDQWEIRPERLQLHEVIGEGAFGVVRRGILSPGAKEVAVKMLKDFPTAEEVRAFRAEAEVMKSVGGHPHVVSLVACVSRRPLLVAEYCARGDLLSYLRSAWDLMVSKRNANSKNLDYRNDLFKRDQKIPPEMVVNRLYDMQGVCDTELTPLDLLSFCRQIAMGMEFLASNRVVHRDLAARNVLVTADRTLKIADFGLSRDVYEENQYKQKGNGKMPIKWMALESLTRRIYTTQSDVWSFGVVMWEIWSLGAAPYEAVSGARLPRLLRAGYRMPRPHCCDLQLYDLMLSCWHEQPRSRPSFSELHARLDAMLAECSHPYLPLNLNSPPEEIPRQDTTTLLAPHRYVRMILRGERVWSRGRSYERPAPQRNYYTTRPDAVL